MHAIRAFLLTAAIASSVIAQCPSPAAFSNCIAPVATATCASGDVTCDCALIASVTGCASIYCPAETLPASVLSAYTAGCLNSGGGSTVDAACPSPTAFSNCVAPVATATCASGDVACDCSLIASITGCASSYCPAETLSASILSAYTAGCLNGGVGSTVDAACPSPTAFSSCVAPVATSSCASGDVACDCTLIASLTDCASSFCPAETLSASILSAYTAGCLNGGGGSTVNAACPSPTAFSQCIAPVASSSCASGDIACDCTAIASLTDCASSFCPAETLSASILSAYTAGCLNGGGGLTSASPITTPTISKPAMTMTPTAAPTTTKGSVGGLTTSPAGGGGIASATPTTASKAGADARFAFSAGSLVAAILGALVWL